MNTLSLSKSDPIGLERIPEYPLPAIDPGVGAPNQIGTAVRIEGQISGQQDMLVDGEVAGSIMLSDHTLTIGSHGKVKANIRAKNVILLGNVEGNIEASDRIEVRGQCSLTGDLRSPRVLIENGAYIKGKIEVIRPERATSIIQNQSATGTSSRWAPEL